MAEEISTIEKMCRSFDTNKMKPILSKKNATSAILTFKDPKRPAVYCPLLGKRITKDNTTLLEHYCKAKKNTICPYTKNYNT
ncbi:hypothetical protein HNV12_01145 [Methanococcoides sp. SA1]|nr:hypothetical protein [Methanococcoides sp. SA1]